MSNLDKNREGGRKALDMGDCSINISDGSELELTLSKKGSSYLKAISKYFCFLVFGRHRRGMMFYIE